ncbi:DUF2244 domain-containing protein [Maritimibacter sp. UBA3975]|uniref:DUF2244 domain-containing protein n=1 Tax=Maritimibacter sp. UBA3975 TaxID=1946833 RepID=UPI000C0B058E|nr:DUF2244 domain-containing protein [Maritimibacter sp. UBA3975]MAM62609.1 hypothetical protein [Maritimibacter sp.]|tara:strand:- start:4319 stop:4861 length:543 start_codon:yes stop_codon:yes gene_type:complete
MPYEWEHPITDAPHTDARGRDAGGAPIAVLHVWPFRSLPKRGFAFAIGFAYVFLMIPISAFVGTVAMWWLLFPGLIAIFGLWWFIGKSYRDGEILEELTIWTDHVRLTRTGPRRTYAEWEANPHWVTVQKHANGGPVKDYITLKGNGREVEIGAFLSEDERPPLFDDLDRAFTLAKSRRG